jgi:hypothetical protein
MSYSLTMTDTKISLELHSILEEAAQHANGLTDFGTGPFVEPL